MNKSKRVFSSPYFLAFSVAAFLLVAVSFPNFYSVKSSAQSENSNSANDYKNPFEKVSPDLRDKINFAQSADDTVSVILQFNDKPSGQLNALLNRNGVHVRAHYQSFNSIAVEL